uniref:NADH-quinone oxidoreductase subunit A n=1 Tax=Thermofilum pendens TaxID=2269 RepID=A0A7J3X6Z5_THEPE
MFLVLLVGLLAGVLVVVLAALMPQGPERGFKRRRYEAGNPPSGEAKVRLPFQYYGYLLLYLSVEPAMVILYLLTFGERIPVSAAFMVLVLLPAVVLGAKLADELERWRL